MISYRAAKSWTSAGRHHCGFCRLHRCCAVAAIVTRRAALREPRLTFSAATREVAADNGLRLAVLIEIYDLLLVTGLMSGIELNESAEVGGASQPDRPGWFRQPLL